MALPNYLAQIKSSGIYRFVWDKSEIAGVPAETLRLVVGYSEKGPFNTPVYISSKAEFKSIFGDVSKKLEKRGVFFHRMALQCLDKGPILALNLKKFEDETVEASSFNVADAIDTKSVKVESIYDTTRFWKLDPEAILPATGVTDKYISITSADSIETSCSVFMRGYKPTGYDVTVASWYASIGEEVPDYFYGENGENWASSLLVSDFFAEMYVFRGEFTKSLCAAEPLNRYFDIDGDNVLLKDYIEDSFGNKLDTLSALAADESSNFLNVYTGCLLPFFKNQNGLYISLDLVFNGENSLHNMMMNLNSDLLFSKDVPVNELVTNGWLDTTTFGTALSKTVQKLQTKVYTADEDGNVTSFELDDVTDYTDTTDPTVPTVFEADFIEYDGTGESKPLDFVRCGFVKGDRVLSSDSSKIWTVTNVTPDGLAVVDVKGTTDTLAANSIVKKCNHFASITNHDLKPVYYKGYTYTHGAPEQGTQKDMEKLKWHKFLLGTLTDYEGIRTGLTNRVDVEYRYIIDTFEGLVDSELHSTLSLIAKEKDNAVAFLNFPSMKVFKECTYANFTDDKGKLQVKYIKEGANKSKAPELLFSLASEVNGASFASYNTPVVFSDGTVKTTVPAAALVSNNFMDKYTTRQPYYVVAGPTYGKLVSTGMIGPDYNFTRKDLDILEPMGVNCTVYVPRLGTYVNSNQTAKQNPVSALSKLNIRELCIYLQDEIEKLLQDYQWEFNTPYLRDLIKAKADTICERVKNNGGLYEYLNVCDESNNTDDVINNEMLVLSTSIEPGMACGKMVQELTIYKKGGMQALIK